VVPIGGSKLHQFSASEIIKKLVCASYYLRATHCNYLAPPRAASDNRVGVQGAPKTAGLRNDINDIGPVHFLAFIAPQRGLLGRAGEVRLCRHDDIGFLVAGLPRRGGNHACRFEAFQLADYLDVG